MLEVLTIDTQPVMAKGIEYLLQENFGDFSGLRIRHVRAFGELRILEEYLPDIILMSANHDWSTLENILQVRMVKDHFIDVPLVVYDGRMDYETITRYFQEGIKGYLGKKFEENELLDCMNLVLRGHKFLSSTTWHLQ